MGRQMYFYYLEWLFVTTRNQENIIIKMEGLPFRIKSYLCDVFMCLVMTYTWC